MVGLLAIAFLVVPIAELAVIIGVADRVGLGNTLGLLILDSLVGAWLVRVQGIGVWRRVQSELARGEMPTSSLIDGVLVLVGGALLLTPGFLTDVVGLGLLIPPVRAALRALVARRMRNRIVVYGVHRTDGPVHGGPGIIDLDGIDDGSDRPG